MIIPVYQPLGHSTHLLAQKVGERDATKATHTGTLDPMAEGVIVVLTDQDRFKKASLSDWQKTYEFSILWGVTTDSLDLLGLVTQSWNSKEITTTPDIVTDTKIIQTQKKFIGKSEQVMPDFSAKRVQGVSAFDVAKRKQSVPQHSQTIEIHSLDLIETKFIQPEHIARQLQTVTPHLKNDFRQDEITQNWCDWADTMQNTELFISTHRAITSKRTYIRALVRDISQEIVIPATTFHIMRTANGPYQVQDCICLL